jgi:hypothetical protein
LACQVLLGIATTFQYKNDDFLRIEEEKRLTTTTASGWTTSSQKDPRTSSASVTMVARRGPPRCLGKDFFEQKANLTAAVDRRDDHDDDRL